jgi:hypothetical protein
MKAVIVFFILSSMGFGQTTESSLKALYGEPVHDTFTVDPKVRIKAVYGSDHQACVLTISGPTSEQELMKIFETAVSAKARGLKKDELLDCAGACVRIIQFENVDFRSGVIGTSQTSEPGAFIIFKRKDCEKAAAEAKKIPLSIKYVERPVRK